MHTYSLKNKHRKKSQKRIYAYTLLTTVQSEAVNQTKLPYDVKLAEKYWR